MSVTLPTVAARPPAPPFADRPVTSDGRFSNAWMRYFTRLNDWVAVVSARQQSVGSVSVAAPAGTASTSFVMMGLGASGAVDIMAASTRAVVTAAGQMSNSSNGGETFVTLNFGSGTAPANGAPNTGTVLTQPAHFIATSGGGSFVPFSLIGLATGLVAGTSYWFDLAVRAQTAGTASVSNVQIMAWTLLDPLAM